MRIRAEYVLSNLLDVDVETYVSHDFAAIEGEGPARRFVFKDGHESRIEIITEAENMARLCYVILDSLALEGIAVQRIGQG